VVTRALGGALPSQPELTSVPARGGERLLLCSDGISDLVPDADLAAILAAHAVPSEAAVALVGAALAAGGRDNATAVVVDLHEVDR
jgi:protein phosphatase